MAGVPVVSVVCVVGQPVIMGWGSASITMSPQHTQKAQETQQSTHKSAVPVYVCMRMGYGAVNDTHQTHAATDDAPMPLPSPPPLPLPHRSGRRQRRRCCRRSLSLLRLTLALPHVIDVAAAAAAGRKCKPAAGAVSAGSGLGVLSHHPHPTSLLAPSTCASSSEMFSCTVAAGAFCSSAATVLRQQVGRPPTKWMRPSAWAPHLAGLLSRRRPLPPNSLHHPSQEHAKSRHGTPS